MRSLFVVGLCLGLSQVAVAGGVNELDEFDVLVEINATDGDAGFQGKINGPAWVRMTVLNPQLREVKRVFARRELREQGLTEFAWESNEPRFTEPGFALDEFLSRFQEGTYLAWGRALGGGLLFAEAEFTHDLPAGPVITSPDAFAPGEPYTITWEAVTDDFRGGALESEIVKYIVVAEYDGERDGEGVERGLEIEVDPDTLQAMIPGDFFPDPADFDPDTFELKVEVGAVEESGNRTFIEKELEVD
jgi:hypothetical protein